MLVLVWLISVCKIEPPAIDENWEMASGSPVNTRPLNSMFRLLEETYHYIALKKSRSITKNWIWIEPFDT